ncbi:DUF2628 domain-containing protein [Ectobacillus panaciterrae]|uniref:DUF2628 domain-containing protein n=1 Tax=Ectobacillus panaciterrae TaxID=363872 RepID=UPI0003FA8177|nr:DUF2628 domain-containing protein [Ectobacillus panaciterrae]
MNRGKGEKERQTFADEREDAYRTKLSWNGWAALFHVAWFGYRKHYMPAFLFLLLLLLTDGAAYYAGWNDALPFINIKKATFFMFFLGMLFFGFFANTLYDRHIRLQAKSGFDPKEPLARRKKGGASKIGCSFMIAAAISAAFLSRFLFPTSTDIIQSVRHGSLYKYPLYTIGESFDDFFQQQHWEYERASDGLELVVFHGYTKDRKHDKVVIEFLVDYHLHAIDPYTLEINGNIQDEARLMQFMDDIFQVENPFEIKDGLENENEKQAM